MPSCARCCVRQGEARYYGKGQGKPANLIELEDGLFFCGGKCHNVWKHAVEQAREAREHRRRVREQLEAKRMRHIRNQRRMYAISLAQQKPFEEVAQIAKAIAHEFYHLPPVTEEQRSRMQNQSQARQPVPLTEQEKRQLLKGKLPAGRISTHQAKDARSNAPEPSLGEPGPSGTQAAPPPQDTVMPDAAGAGNGNIQPPPTAQAPDPDDDGNDSSSSSSSSDSDSDI